MVSQQKQLEFDRMKYKIFTVKTNVAKNGKEHGPQSNNLK